MFSLSGKDNGLSSEKTRIEAQVSYQIFARKYRPQTFDELVGQKAVVQTLKNAVQNNRVAQAYIFTGMRGVGKTSAARILAKALNCVHGPTPTPCNACEHCRSITEDRAIDVIEIDGASNTGVDDVRALRDAVKYRPLQTRYKVVVIDEVHMLSKAAFNALLKTLEEPPPQTVFIFATTEFQKVPATIVSRSQHFEFKKISHKDIINHLLGITQKEGILITDFGLSLLAEAADGSLRDAESLLDQAVAFSGTDIPDDDLKEILGTLSKDILFAFSSAILDQKPQAIFTLVEQVVDAGYDLRFFLKELVQHFRNLLLVKTVDKPEELLAMGPEDIARLGQEAQRAQPEDFLRYLLAFQAAEPSLRHSSHPRIALEALLLKLAHYQSLIPLQDLLQELEGLKNGEADTRTGPDRPQAPGGGRAPAGAGPAVRTAPRNADPAPRPDSLKTLMPKILTYLQRDRSSLAAILNQSSSWKVEEEPLDIKFNHDQRFTVSRPLTLRIYFPAGKGDLVEVVDRDVKLIEKAATEAAGQRVCVKASEETAPVASGARPRPAGELDAALKDPTVQHFMDTFRARIVSGEPIKKPGGRG
jgi:DNA polymerase-3 subunit gamma/tau